MKFTCTFGHVDPKTGKPVVHLSRSRCEIYRRLLKERKIDVNGNPIKAPAPTAQPEGPKPDGNVPASAPSSEATPPAPTETTLQKMARRLRSGLEISYHHVSTTPPEAANAAAKGSAESAPWELKDETVVRFWETLFGFIETALNMLCEALQIPKLEHAIFEVDEGQKYVFTTALKGFTTNILKKVFLAKSPEDADRIVAGLGGILGFGIMTIKIVTHFIVNVPKSPRLAKWRERVAERAKKARDRREAQENAETKKGEVTVGATGTPGPAPRVTGA